MHPLRVPGTTTTWQTLNPPSELTNQPLRRKQHKTRGLVLQFAGGGRCKKHKIIYVPAKEPVRFKLGHGPALDDTGLSYYSRPEHLQTNRTKNKNPGKEKTLIRIMTCCILPVQSPSFILYWNTVRRKIIRQLADTLQHDDIEEFGPESRCCSSSCFLLQNQVHLVKGSCYQQPLRPEVVGSGTHTCLVGTHEECMIK